MLERMRASMVAEDGSLNLEMALIIGLLVIVAVVGLTFLGKNISNSYNQAGNSVNGVDYTVGS